MQAIVIERPGDGDGEKKGRAEPGKKHSSGKALGKMRDCENERTHHKRRLGGGAVGEEYADAGKSRRQGHRGPGKFGGQILPHERQEEHNIERQGARVAIEIVVVHLGDAAVYHGKALVLGRQKREGEVERKPCDWCVKDELEAQVSHANEPSDHCATEIFAPGRPFGREEPIRHIDRRHDKREGINNHLEPRLGVGRPQKRDSGPGNERKGGKRNGALEVLPRQGPAREHVLGQHQQIEDEDEGCGGSRRNACDRNKDAKDRALGVMESRCPLGSGYCRHFAMRSP